MRLGRRLVPALIFSVRLQAACTVTPNPVPQGKVLHLTCDATARTAHLKNRVVNLFAQTDGTTLGLMPVPVLEKPGSYELTIFGSDPATPTETIPVRVSDARYPRQNVAIASSTAALKPSPGEQEAVTDFRKAATPTRYWQDAMALPVPGCLTSPFGVQRFFNGKPTGDFHAGLDQRGAEGTPIHAIAPGVVKLVRDFNLRGGTVAIDHGQGVESIYMHMFRTAAVEGAKVSEGDIIGYVGATGRANGPHLHWTLYVNGVPVNPAQWMKVPASCYAISTPSPRRRPRLAGAP